MSITYSERHLGFLRQFARLLYLEECALLAGDTEGAQDFGGKAQALRLWLQMFLGVPCDDPDTVCEELGLFEELHNT